MAQLDLSELYPDHVGPPLPRINVPGSTPPTENFAVYRIGFQSMVLPGFPPVLRVGRTVILQTGGPVMTQQTEVVQRPQPRLAWDKMLSQMEVGRGLPLTICHLPVTIGAESKFAVWRNEVYSSLGLVVALLDNRLAQREVLEDIALFEDGRWSGLADARLRIRNFLPYTVTDDDRGALGGLANPAPTSASAAARWYLRGARLGPAADAITFFWIALESLAESEGRYVVRKIEDALRDAGEDPSDIEPSLGRLWASAQTSSTGVSASRSSLEKAGTR